MFHSDRDAEGFRLGTHDNYWAKVERREQQERFGDWPGEAVVPTPYTAEQIAAELEHDARAAREFAAEMDRRWEERYFQ